MNTFDFTTFCLLGIYLNGYSFLFLFIFHCSNLDSDGPNLQGGESWNHHILKLVPKNV